MSILLSVLVGFGVNLVVYLASHPKLSKAELLGGGTQDQPSYDIEVYSLTPKSAIAGAGEVRAFINGYFKSDVSYRVEYKYKDSLGGFQLASFNPSKKSFLREDGTFLGLSFNIPGDDVLYVCDDCAVRVVAGKSASKELKFTIIPPGDPVISSIEPNSLSKGKNKDYYNRISVKGSNFSQGALVFFSDTTVNTIVGDIYDGTDFILAYIPINLLKARKDPYYIYVQNPSIPGYKDGASRNSNKVPLMVNP